MKDLARIPFLSNMESSSQRPQEIMPKVAIRARDVFEKGCMVPEAERL